ncbi:hypothetical protein ACFL1S_03765 [Pseudomonadota bacterium]
MFCLTPPSLEAFCLNQVKGVSKAQDQPPGPAAPTGLQGIRQNLKRSFVISPYNVPVQPRFRLENKR